MGWGSSRRRKGTCARRRRRRSYGGPRRRASNARTHVLAEECRRLKADSGLNKISSPSVETLGFDISALPGLCGRIISWVGGSSRRRKGTCARRRRRRSYGGPRRRRQTLGLTSSRKSAVGKKPTRGSIKSALPALKRWALIYRPCRALSFCQRRYCVQGKKRSRFPHLKSLLRNSRCPDVLKKTSRLNSIRALGYQ